MASRAFTAMLMMAVSNWPASALTKHGSSGPRMTISMREPIRVPIISAQRLHASSDLEHLRLQRLPPREGQQLPGQLGGAGHRIGDRLDIAQPPRLRQVGPPQQVHRSADHREQIVEVVRDAAGELAQRLQPLAVLQRFLGLLPLLGFEIKMPRPAQGQPQQGKQQRGGRRAEDQMLAHGGQPARPDRRGLEAGADIERIFGEPPVAEAALDAVGRRRHGDEAGRWTGSNYFPDRTPGVETDVAVDGGETRQHGAVRPAEREVAAGLAADPGVVILEIFREHGSLQHAAEAAVLARAPSADAEERGALIGRPRLQGFTDKGSDIAGRVGLEIVPVRKIDLGRRHDQAVDEGVALGVENPGRFHLRQRGDQLLQPQMQQLLARNDVGIGNVADDLGDLRQAAVDGLEYFQRMFVRDIQRAFDIAVGGFADRDPGDGGCKYEQRQRKGQRSDHHPLQQSQRITLRGLHVRSGSAPSLTQSSIGNKVPSMELRWLAAADLAAL